MVSTPKQMLNDESHREAAGRRSRQGFSSRGDATVEAHILGDGVTETVDMRPDALERAFTRRIGRLRSRDRTWWK